MSEFTSNLKKYRQLSGLTQEELAKIAGVRRETIVRLELGKYTPSLKLAIDISRAVKAPIEEIFVFFRSVVRAADDSPLLCAPALSGRGAIFFIGPARLNLIVTLIFWQNKAEGLNMEMSFDGVYYEPAALGYELSRMLRKKYANIAVDRDRKPQ
jgi:DNA-binding XRE family transcriptional regulator